MSDALLLGLDNNYVSQRTEKLDTLTPHQIMRAKTIIED